MKIKCPKIVSHLLQIREISFAVILLPPLFLTLNFMGIYSWECPFHHLTGLDCPGCGMTRGIKALVSGDISGALSLHPFAPIFSVIWILWSSTAFLSQEKREKVAEKVGIIEASTFFVPLLFLAYTAFGIMRLVLEISRN